MGSRGGIKGAPHANNSRLFPASRIRRVINAGLGRSDVLAFWFGRSDRVTPTLVRDAAARSLARGRTFYAHSLGLGRLRGDRPLHRHVARRASTRGASPVTSVGRERADAGDACTRSGRQEVVTVVPVLAQPDRAGADPQRDGASASRSTCRTGAVADRPRGCARRSRRRVLLVNAPNNPDRLDAHRDEQRTILDTAATGTLDRRRRIYERMWFGASRRKRATLLPTSPATEGRLVVVRNFSKSFLMTGWRLGWLVLPRGHPAIKLIKFSTSRAPVFVQRGGLAALAHAAVQIGARCGLRTCRDHAAAAPGRCCRGSASPPPRAGMYAFLPRRGRGGFARLRQAAGRNRPRPRRRVGVRRQTELAALVLRLARASAWCRGGRLARVLDHNRRALPGLQRRRASTARSVSLDRKSAAKPPELDPRRAARKQSACDAPA